MRWEPDRIRGEHARDRVPIGPPHGGRVLLDGRADRGEVVFKQCHGFDIISDTSALTFNGRSSGPARGSPEWIEAEWGALRQQPEARSYELTKAGRKRLGKNRIEIPCAENL